MHQPTKVLKWAKAYDLADLYDDSRLAGFVVAAVEGGMHGVRLNLVATPPWVDAVKSDGDQVSSN